MLRHSRLQRVPTNDHLEAAVSQWVGWGYDIVHKEPCRARLVRVRRLRKRYAFVGLLLGGIGLVIYLVAFALGPRWETVDVLVEGSSTLAR